MSILIKGGRIIDPSRNFDKVGNILIEKGTIKSYPEDTKKLEKDSAITGNRRGRQDSFSRDSSICTFI